MMQVARSWWVRALVVVLAVAGCGALIAASLTEEEAISQVEFDAKRYASILSLYERSAVTCLQDLVDEWEWDVYTMLPVAPPDPDYPLHTGHNRSRLLASATFTKSSLNKLAPVTRSADGREYTAYPIRVQEDPITRSRLIYATGSSKPKLIATVWPPLGYDPLWVYYERYPFGKGSDFMRSLYEPARIICEMDLVEESGIQAIAAAAATITPSIALDEPIMMMSYSGPSVTNIKIVACERTNDVIELTIAYPDDYTNALEIFTADGGNALINSWWKPAGSTNVDTSTNWVEWTDHDSTNPIPCRFYYVWNADIDSDDDDFSDGFERLVSHTLTNDATSYPVSISGTISYTGSLTGPVRMLAVTVSNSWVGPMARIPVPGAYTNDHVANSTSYWFKAYRDCDWDNEKEYGEPWGIYSNSSQLVTNDLTGINITIGDKDEDQDGLIDWWEMQYFGDLDETPSGDPDSDGLTNGAERVENTDPSDYDTDDDGLVDGYDGHCSTSVYSNVVEGLDLDADGYVDGEFDYGTDPLKADTDEDGYDDPTELQDGTNPLDADDPASIAGTVSYDTQHGGGGQTGTIYVVAVTNASSWSTNYSDSIASTGAYLIGWIPTNEVWVKAWRDSDANGLVGTYEATGAYSSASMALAGDHTGIDVTLTDPDTDSDGMGDWWELIYWEFLSDWNGTGDPDVDKVSNILEYENGTDPTAGFVDTDSDGMSDDWEEINGLDKNDASDANEDPDLDGFTNVEEYENGGSPPTDPNDPNSHPSGVVYVDAVNGNDSTGDGSYTNEYRSISKGISSVVTGERVVVQSGTYTGSVNRAMDFSGKDILLLGVEGADKTIIDCESSGRAFYFHSYETTNSVIRGFCFKNGYVNSGNGGAISCYYSAPIIMNCAFLTNSAPYGGAIGAYPSSSPEIYSCTFSGNSATQYGGALYSPGDSLTVENCLFTTNSANSRGGALCVRGGGSGTVLVDGCVFDGNSAGYEGGGINLYQSARDVIIRNCRVTRNSADWAAGIYTHVGSASATIESCTIADNIGDYGEGGVDRGSRTTLKNCIVWGNTPAQVTQPYGGEYPSYCVIQGWHYTTNNTQNTNPQFVDEDYSIAYLSPCMDAGGYDAWMATGKDIYGQERVTGGAVDIGAHELTVHFVDVTSTNSVAPYTAWTNAAVRIQDAIDAVAEDHAVVIVADGVYSTGLVSVGTGAVCRVAVTRPVRVSSVNGAEHTIIVGEGPSGENAVRCAYVGAGASLVGFTLTNGHTRTSGSSLYADGGGAWCEPGARVADCMIISNLAARGGGVCGGLLLTSMLKGNSATDSGGGVYGGTNRSCLLLLNQASSGGGVCDAVVESGTVVSNSATVGGGISGCTALNSIVYYNAASNVHSSSLLYSCSTPLVTGVGNIDDAPGFTSPGEGNFRLDTNSVCIDVGTVTNWMVDAVDLDGLPRVRGYGANMGAYESDHRLGPSNHPAYINLMLALDTSGSMSVDEESAMKQYAGWLVDCLKVGDMAGVVSFGDNPQVETNLLYLDEETTKGDVRSASCGAEEFAQNETAAALAVSQAELDSRGHADDAHAVVLISDSDNGEFRPEDYMDQAPYDTRVDTISLFSGWDHDFMSWCAQRRRGFFLASPTPVGVMSLDRYYGIMGTNGTLTSGTQSHDVLVDRSISHLTLRVSGGCDDPAPTLVLEVPGGQSITEASSTSMPDVVYSEYGSSASYLITSPTNGLWEMKVSGGTNGAEYAVFAYGDTCIGAELHFDRLQYTANENIPIILHTSTNATNVHVVATNVFAYEESAVVPVYDDGLHGDGGTNDGVYGGVFSSSAGDSAWRIGAEVYGELGNGDSFARVTEQSIYVANSRSQLDTPTNVLATSGSYTGQVMVSWSSVTNAGLYDVYRNDSDSRWGAELIAVTADNSICDTDVEPSQSYYYWVRAYRRDYSSYIFYLDSEFSESDSGYAAP